MKTSLEKLNQPKVEKRLTALREIVNAEEFPQRNERYINNHIHTIFSFSPYSPTAAVYSAAKAGLCTAGIIDHDSIAGASEFLKAADIQQLPVTCGFELRVSWKNSPFAEKRINNPDQDGVAYMTMQGVAKRYFEEVAEFLKPLREKRNLRNRKMVLALNKKLDSEMQLNFEQDVIPLSQYEQGGSITERHLMYALAKKMTAILGKGENTIQFLTEQGIKLTEKQQEMLLDTSYSFYEYDVLNILKSSFLPQIFIPADDELCTLEEFVALGRKIHAIPCYAYLGDVTNSVTGDKAAQKFEDDYLEELFDYLDEAGIKAVTYMPARNTEAQLKRLKKLCVERNKFQISGEDINSPRQNFICYAMEKTEFTNLIDSTWALIAHERATEKDPDHSFFSEKMEKAYPNVEDRIAYFKGLIK